MVEEIADSHVDDTAERYREFLLWFMRSLGLVFLLFGITYWRPIIGLVGDPEAMFSALPLHEQIPTMVFAVLLPVAATGLWFGASWGIGLVAISLGIRAAMAFGFTDYFEPDWIVLGGHVAIIMTYVIMRIVIHRHR